MTKPQPTDILASLREDCLNPFSGRCEVLTEAAAEIERLRGLLDAANLGATARADGGGACDRVDGDRIDATKAARAVERADGSWEFDGVATRGDAVFDYSNEAGIEWREYRPLDEVFAADSIASLAGCALTDMPEARGLMTPEYDGVFRPPPPRMTECRRCLGQTEAATFEATGCAHCKPPRIVPTLHGNSIAPPAVTAADIAAAAIEPLGVERVLAELHVARKFTRAFWPHGRITEFLVRVTGSLKAGQMTAEQAEEIAVHMLETTTGMSRTGEPMP